MDPEKIVMGLLWYLVFLFSTTIHEAAHAWSADILGDSTAADGGQSTINPVPHIQREPFGMVFIPLLTFVMSGGMIGWGSAPYEPTWAYRHPRRAAIMALAGPLSNLLIVLSAATLLQLGLAFDLFFAPERVSESFLVGASSPELEPIVAVLSVLFSLNLLLFVFNLIPLPPLDGLAVVTLLMPLRTARTVQEFRGGAIFMLVGLILAPKLAHVLAPVLVNFSLVLMFPWTSYS